MRATSPLCSWSWLWLWCVWSATWAPSSGDVRKPSATTVVQAFRSGGLRISVPDVPGLDVVVINANINQPIAIKENGQITGSVLEARNGFWTLENNDVQLKVGDVVFFWLYTATGDTGDRVTGHQAIRELVDSSCRPTSTTYNGKTACAGQLIFEDNFDSLDTSVWKHSIQFTDDPDLDFAIYTDRPENSFVKDGTLHLKATVLTTDELLTHTKLEKCTWSRGGADYCERYPKGWNILPPTYSALLTTKGTFSFKFGRIDIRAKAAAGEWLHSRVLLDSLENFYGSGYGESGRLEIVRVKGNANNLEPSGWEGGAWRNHPQAVVATCHRSLAYWNSCINQHRKLLSDDMYLYSVIWTPEHITVKLNECEHKIAPPKGSFLETGYFKGCENSQWEKGTHFVPFDREFYMQISLLPGGFNLYVHDLNSSGHIKPWKDKDPRAFLSFWKSQDTWLPTWKSDMEVDYIKVWAL